MRARIKKNDSVVVIAGRDRGKTGKVLRVLPDCMRALVEGINVVHRHQKARTAGGTQGIIDKEAPIHLSNLMVVCPQTGKATRLAKKILEDGRSIRICKVSGAALDE